MPPLSEKITQGPDHAVPCPHCGQPNDFRQLDDVVTPDVDGHVGGQNVICDHCQKNMEVVQIRRVTFIAVKQALPV